MLKKLQTISWGGWSAVLALVLFAGLAVYPLIGSRAEAATLKGAKGKDDGLLAMIDKAKEKSAEAKMDKEKGEHGERRLELKAVASTANGTLYVGAKTGLFSVVEGKLAPVAAFPSTDIKTLAAGPDGSLYVATKMGAYRLAPGADTAAVIREGDVQSIGLGADGALLLVSKREGILSSRDQGANWAPVTVELPIDNSPRGGPKTDEQRAKERAEREAAKQTEEKSDAPAAT